MGTKVQCKSYLPRYYPMRDLNEEASSNWSPFYDDTSFNRQLLNDVKLGLVNGYSEYDREMLKRTMLEHEAVFRKQVYELHRLYSKQKDMMDEYRGKQFHRLCRTTETSKSSFFSSQVPSEAGEIRWRASTPYLISGHCKSANISDANENSMQYNPSANIGGHMKNYELIQNGAKRSRRIIDLHLPADAYIDSEYTEADTENSKPCFRDVDPLNSVSVQHDSDFKLTLGSDEACRQNEYKAGIGPSSGFPLRGFTDLNEPVEDLCDERGAGSSSFISNALKIQSKDILLNQRPRTPGGGFLPSKFLMLRDTEEGAFLSHMNADKGQRKPEWPSLHDSVGRDRSIIGSLNSGYFTSEYPMSSEPIPLRLKKPEKRQLCDNNKSGPWSGERTEDPPNIYSSPQLFDSRYLTTQATNAAPSGKNISHAQAAVQAFPPFGGSAVTNELSNSKTTENKYDFIGRKEFTAKQDSNGVLWHNKPPCSGVANLNLCGSWTDSEFAKHHRQLISSLSKVNHNFPMEDRSDKNGFFLYPQNSLSSLKVENKVQKKEKPEIMIDGRTLGFPSLKNIPESFNCSASALYSEQSLADNQKYSEDGKNIQTRSLGVRCEINLNYPVEEEKVYNEMEDIRCSADELKSDRLAKPIDLSKENVNSNDSLQEAASTIVSMSTGSHSNLGSTIPNLLPPVSSCDYLTWFAEVITSNCEVSDNNGLDLFEYMTLKLDEVKEDYEHRHRPYYYQNEEPKDEAKCAASLLFTRPRRGQARRRRQKKDFQKVVLPTLASLSRKEVTEDLQALGGLTRNSGSGKRGTTRSGLKCTARSRRPRSMAAATVVEVCIDPPPLQPSENELGIDVSIKGWGRTTRRCRRQRVPASMVISAPQA